MIDNTLNSWEKSMMALRLGDNDQLIPVILAYRKGLLKKYKDEIEKKYLPEYENLPDEEKVTYFGLGFIAVLKPRGKADLIEFDLDTQPWEELAEIIDAQQLESIHSEKLDQLSEAHELDGHITSWYDSSGKSEYGILTLEDEEKQQHCFDDIYQLEQIVAALGYEVERISYDEFPDDDGRYDPYA